MGLTDQREPLTMKDGRCFSVGFLSKYGSFLIFWANMILLSNFYLIIFIGLGVSVPPSEGAFHVHRERRHFKFSKICF